MNINGIQVEEEKEMASLRWGSYSKRININSKKNDAIIQGIKELQTARSEERKLADSKRKISEGTGDAKTL